MVNAKLKLGILIALGIVCAGCAVAKVSQPAFSATARRGYYANAAQLARGEIGPLNTHHDLLWNLQLGTMERLLKNYESSNVIFDQAESAYRAHDLRSLLAQSWSTSKSLIFNDSALLYTGRHYERVMVNTYKALNFAALGDSQNARIEFNRALVRQDEAKAFYAAEIQHMDEERARRRQSGEARDDAVEASMNNPELKRIIDERYKNLDSFKSYRDFINPYTNFCAGLFFWLQGDAPKAVDILKVAHAISGHEIVAEVFARAARGDQPSGELWVIFENGMAPAREEIRIDIPLILAGTDIKYVGAAFANLTEGQPAYDHLTLTTDDGQNAQTTPFADMAGVIAQEFQKELPLVTFREVSRVVFKTMLQYQMNQNYGFFAGLVGAIYQAATTAVDIRSWSTLPYDFHVAHLNISQSQNVMILAGDHDPQIINLVPQARNMILYVRAMSSETAPVVDIIPFY